MLSKLCNDINMIGFCVVFIGADQGLLCVHCMACAPIGYATPCRGTGARQITTTTTTTGVQMRAQVTGSHHDRIAAPQHHGRIAAQACPCRDAAQHSTAGPDRAFFPITSFSIRFALICGFVVAKQQTSLKAGPNCPAFKAMYHCAFHNISFHIFYALISDT